MWPWQVASVPFLFQLKTQTVSHQYQFFKNTFHYPSDLKIGLSIPKAFGKIKKNEARRGRRDSK